MSNITIQNVQGSLVVDSRLVADQLGILHKNFKELIKTYRVDFEEFGHLSVTSVGVKGTSSYAEFYYLNEDQSYLALTYSLNTPQVRAAKLKLVQAFRAAREANYPNDYLSALKALVSAEEERQQLLLKAAEAEQKVIEMAPKVAEWEALCDSNGLMTMQQVARVLAIPRMGRTNLFAFLRSIGVLDLANGPYSKFVDNKYFQQKVKVNKNTGKEYLVTLVSYKGFSFIHRRLQKAGYISPNAPTPNEAALAVA